MYVNSGVESGIYTIEYAGEGACKGTKPLTAEICYYIVTNHLFVASSRRIISFLCKMGQELSGDGQTAASRRNGARKMAGAKESPRQVRH